MTLDVRARATALKLIGKFGKSISYTAITDGVYDPETGAVTPTETTYTVKAVVEAYSLKGDGFVSGLIREGDRKISIPASGLSFTPKAGDKVTFDSDAYQVLNVSPTYSGELIALWELHGRKS